MLVWAGGASATVAATTPAPAAYTPTHLAEGIRVQQYADRHRDGADGERKTITALFADLQGSTGMIGGLDREDAQAPPDPALRIVMGAVHRHEGFVFVAQPL